MKYQTQMPLGTDCRRTRLAESSIAAVDVCECGMMQLHIGAFTLRLAPRAVSELLSTLGQAVAKQSARRVSEQVAAAAPSFSGTGRGEA